MFSCTGPGSRDAFFPGSASSWVILALISHYRGGKIKTTEHFKLQMWPLPPQHWCCLIYANCSAEGQRAICGRAGFPDRPLNFPVPSGNHKPIFPHPVRNSKFGKRGANTAGGGQLKRDFRAPWGCWVKGRQRFWA